MMDSMSFAARTSICVRSSPSGSIAAYSLSPAAILMRSMGVGSAAAPPPAAAAAAAAGRFMAAPDRLHRPVEHAARGLEQPELPRIVAAHRLQGDLPHITHGCPRLVVVESCVPRLWIVRVAAFLQLSEVAHLHVHRLGPSGAVGLLCGRFEERVLVRLHADDP